VSQLPAHDRLFAAQRVLLLGAGGGYDVFGGVPLFMELRARGIAAHFAGVSFTGLESLAGAEPDPRAPCLYRVDGTAAVRTGYCPEAWLARWLAESQGYREPVWALSKVGVGPLRAALAVLVERLRTDLIVLVDGGIDLCLRGDETSIGTPAEDLATLCAVAGLKQPSLAMCIGFGTELREGIPHAQVLERIAELQRLGAFLGATTLDGATPAGAAYREALAFVQGGQQDQRGTHIHTVVLASMAGQFGSSGPDVWISPLASICWFFDAHRIAGSHLFLKNLEQTETIWDVTNVIRSCRKALEVRPRSEIPI
jgi:hypothetical protein